MYKLKKYSDNYYNFVYEVKKEAYKKYVEENFGQWDEEVQKEYFDKFINDVKENAYIIEFQNKDIGFYNGEILENGDYEIGNICIIPEYQGKGIGTKILKDIIKQNIERDIKLQYFKQNPVGKLYQRLGFILVGEGEYHYKMEKTKIKIELKQLSTDMGKAEYDMLQNILDVENGFTNPAYNLSFEEYKEWLKEIDNHSKSVDLPEGWIPYTTYFLYINDIPVGYGRVRHTSSEYLENVIGAGNLGYGISKEHRGKGYGNILFIELLKKCKDFGYKEIKLFPLKSNEATIKIMIKNGGKIVGNFKDEKHIISIQITNN